jgi:murein DD-endopeptidase MepM/ murein hydrolase activator NlpD
MPAVPRRLFAASLLLLLVGQMAIAPPAPAVNSIQQRRLELQSQNRRIAEKRRKIRELAQQKESVNRSISAVQQQLEVTETKLSDTQYKYQLASHAVAQTSRQLSFVSVRYQRQLYSARRRLRSIYKLSPNQALTYVLGATDLTQAMSRLMYFRYVANKDSEMLANLATTRHEMEDLKGQQLRKKQTFAELGKTYEQQAGQFADQKEELGVYKERLQSAIAANERELRIMEQESSQIETMLRRLIASQSRSSSRKRLGSGRLAWPLFGSITSPFGYRTHPIFKRQIFHSGLDISAGHGTPIRAADGGRVVEAGWRGGYGKVVIIDHGGGIATLYGHCSATHVSPGQMVSKGQVVASVGATGWATGPHLHFEVRRDGTPTNPSAWL